MYLFRNEKFGVCNVFFLNYVFCSGLLHYKQSSRLLNYEHFLHLWFYDFKIFCVRAAVLLFYFDNYYVVSNLMA